MAYMTLLAHCANCKRPFSCNPDYVPSIRVKGTRQPICEVCFDRWNQIQRIDKGLPAWPLTPGAYEPEEVA